MACLNVTACDSLSLLREAVRRSEVIALRRFALPAAPGFFSRPLALPTQPKGRPLLSFPAPRLSRPAAAPVLVSAFLRAATKPCAVLLPGEKRRGRIGRELFRGGPSASVRSAALAAAPSPQGKGWLVGLRIQSCRQASDAGTGAERERGAAQAGARRTPAPPRDGERCRAPRAHTRVSHGVGRSGDCCFIVILHYIRRDVVVGSICSGSGNGSIDSRRAQSGNRISNTWGRQSAS